MQLSHMNPTYSSTSDTSEVATYLHSTSHQAAILDNPMHYRALADIERFYT